jgi:hypothetical protein
MVVTEAFLQPNAIYNATDIDDSQTAYDAISGSANDFAEYPGSTASSIAVSTMQESAANSTLVKYSNADCMAEYATTFVSKSRNVLLVTTDTNSTNQYLGAQSWEVDYEVPYFWICGASWSPSPYLDHSPVCTLGTAQASAESWEVQGHPISYCMVQQVPEECRVNFSLVVMLIIIIANAIKAATMLYTFYKLDSETLVTVGDATASFLTEPDPTTEGICLLSKEDIQKGKWKEPQPKRWIPKRLFWFKAASLKRWLTCNIL